MHYYTFNIGDYASHTKGLSLLEDLAYRRLLDEYYLAERPFNGCSTTVARLIGMRGHEAEVDYVLATFFEQDTQGCWVNHRADREIQRFQRKSEQASKAGKASAERKHNGRLTDVQQTLNGRSTDEERTFNQPITNNQQPTTSNQQPVTKNQKTRTKKQDPRLFSLDDMIEVSGEIATEFIKHRKAVKAPLSRIAWEQLVKEAAKAGWTVEDAVRECISRGWRSFKAEWVPSNVLHKYTPTVFSDQIIDGECYESE